MPTMSTLVADAIAAHTDTRTQLTALDDLARDLDDAATLAALAEARELAARLASVLLTLHAAVAKAAKVSRRAVERASLGQPVTKGTRASLVRCLASLGRRKS